MTRIDILIDKETLPKNGQKVIFDVHNKQNLIGIYDEESEYFIVSESEFYSIFNVYNWEPCLK